MTGLFAVILVYGLIVARGLRAALQSRESFGKLLAAGLSFAFALQVFTIIGGVTRLLPLTGLTTPFMSQGGSSLVCNWVVIGLLMVICHHARKPVATAVELDSDAETTQFFGSSSHPATPSAGGDRVNRPIRRVAFVAMLMFALLFANGTYLVLFQQASLDANGLNRRTRDAEFAQDRGAILAAGSNPSPSPGARRTGSASSAATPRTTCTPPSPASTPTTTAGPVWRAPTTASSPAPTTRCSSGG